MDTVDPRDPSHFQDEPADSAVPLNPTLEHEEAVPLENAPLSPEFLTVTDPAPRQPQDHQVTPETTDAPKDRIVETSRAIPADPPPPQSVRHVYPDGCEVFGVPPFPEMSPLEVRAKELRDATPPQDAVARAEAAKEAAAIASQQAEGQVRLATAVLANSAAALAALDAKDRAVEEQERLKRLAERLPKASNQPDGIVTADGVQQTKHDL